MTSGKSLPHSEVYSQLLHTGLGSDALWSLFQAQGGGKSYNQLSLGIRPIFSHSLNKPFCRLKRQAKAFGVHSKEARVMSLQAMPASGPECPAREGQGRRGLLSARGHSLAARESAAIAPHHFARPVTLDSISLPSPSGSDPCCDDAPLTYNMCGTQGLKLHHHAVRAMWWPVPHQARALDPSPPSIHPSQRHSILPVPHGAAWLRRVERKWAESGAGGNFPTRAHERTGKEAFEETFQGFVLNGNEWHAEVKIFISYFSKASLMGASSQYKQW